MAVRLIDRRIGLLFGVFLLLLLLAMGRAAWIAGIRGGALKAAANSQQVSEVVVPAQRGPITDRNGVPLAVSEPAADVAATPYLIKDPVAVAKRIAPIIDQSEANVLKALTARDTGFSYVARELDDGAAQKLEKMDIEGLDFIPSSRRTYPQNQLAAQVIGTVGTDGVGLAGLEYARNKLLGGRNGERRLVKDAIGQPISLQDQSAMVAGTGLQLTIDAAIQDKAESVLAEVGKAFQPKGATAIVMDPRTGEVLADANWPPVNANHFGASTLDARSDKSVVSAYEPGSTFKAFTVAGALSDNTVRANTTFQLGPSIQVADRTINEAHGGGGTLTTAQILAQSSNVGAVTIGLRMGATRFDQWVHRFGFGRPTGIDLAGEQGGIVPRAKDYSGSSMGNLPIGQGLAVTPMQMATAYAAIANGGIMRRPRIIKEVGNRPVPEPRGTRVIASSTAASVRQMLEGVLEAGGTAAGITIPGYVLAGKTGTANKPDPKTGGYSKTKYVASFVGFAPAKDPRLLVTVMVDEPQGAYYGAAVAAPAFQKITSFALPYLRIPPS